MPMAARLTDMHTCPMVTAVVPHVGGPITGPGAPTVYIKRDDLLGLAGGGNKTRDYKLGGGTVFELVAGSGTYS